MAVKRVSAERRTKKEPEKKANAGRSVKSIDYTFLFLIMLMLSIGLVMLLSASAPAGASKFNDSYHFFKRQIGFVAVGLVGMVVVSKIDYRIYKKYAKISQSGEASQMPCHF